MAKLLDRILDRYLEKRAERIKLPGGIIVPRTQQKDALGMTLSAVWSAVMLLSGHLSAVPLNLYEKIQGGGKRKATDNPLWKTLHSEPYPGLSSYEFREALVANIEFYGVGYVQVTYGGGRLNLVPFNSSHVTPNRQKKVFTISNGKGHPYDVPASQMIVFPTLTLDGINPIHVANKRKRSISLAISYEERAESFNTNGSIPAAVAIWGQGYNKLSQEQKIRLEKKWEELYQGVGKSGGTAFMPEGSDFKTISFDPESLQMLGSREFSVQEIARWFGIKPHKLADLSRATFSNIEHLSIEHIMDTILPRARKIESILTLALIPEEKREQYFIEFNLDGLQRGDFESRMKSYAVGKQWGWLSTNDIRNLENMNPLPPEQGGDLYLVPLNMIPANQVGAGIQSSGQREITTSKRFSRSQIFHFRAAATVRRNITNGYKPLFERAQEGLTKKEIDQIREAAEKNLPMNPPGFLQFLDEFYSDDVFTPEVKSSIRPIITAYAEEMESAALEEIGTDTESIETNLVTVIDDYVNNFSYRYVKSNKSQLKRITKEAGADDERNSLEEVNQRLDEWEEKEPGKLRDNEPIRAEGAFSKAAWMAAGVVKIVWVTFGESCPYCNQLSGKTIGVQDYFVGKGIEVSPEGHDPLIPNTNIGHPQLHQGCDCGIAAVIGG